MNYFLIIVALGMDLKPVTVVEPMPTVEACTAAMVAVYKQLDTSKTLAAYSVTCAPVLYPEKRKI